MNGLSETSAQASVKPPRPEPTPTRSVAPACVVLYLITVATLLVTILVRNHGVFTYTLDDPYIHLALAEQIAHGHYGINPGEPSSPSSSILWPFLLTPFARAPLADASWPVYLPLAWNVLCCALAAWLLGRLVDAWDWPLRDSRTASPLAQPGGPGQPAPKPASPTQAWLTRLAPAVLLLLIANLAGLTFLGMEHGLQVLLAVACAAGMTRAFAGRPIPAWSLAAAVLSPAVRYEDFALVAALALALYGQGRRRAALSVAALSLVVPLCFSLFLHSQGLSALPSSVLVKSSVYRFHSNPIANALATVRKSVAANAQTYAWWAQLAVLLMLAGLLLREPQRTRRFVLAGAALAALGQLLLGQVNWFYRYEVYALIFAVLVTVPATCAALTQRLRQQPPRLRHAWLPYGLLLAGLTVFAARYALALYQTPAQAARIYQQQYQMHRFLADYYRGTVAVNDLGLVSYRRPAGVYVLDLWGLASPEASRRAVKDADWLDTITGAHHAGLAMIYPDWFDEGAPDDWEPLGTLCLPDRETQVGRPCVVFYSTTAAGTPALRAQFAAFARTLPTGLRVTLNQDTTATDE